MAISTYTELKSAIESWLDRTDLDTVIPDFVMIAEAGFNRVLRHRRMLSRTTADVDTEYTSLPSDFLEMKALQINGDPIRSLTYLNPMEMDKADATYSVAAKPVYFSVINDYFQVLPIPDQTYVGELIYYAKVPALGASQTTNWLLDDHPDIYLYGALRQASPYLREDERLPVWESLFLTRIGEAQADSDRGETYGSSLRIQLTPLGEQ